MAPADCDPLPRFLRERRRALGLTQRAVADHVGFKSLAHLSDIEAGNRKPGEEHLPKLAEILDVPLAEIEARDERFAVRELRELLERRPEFIVPFRAAVALAEKMEAREFGKLFQRAARQKEPVAVESPPPPPDQPHTMPQAEPPPAPKPKPQKHSDSPGELLPGFGAG